MPFRSEKQRRYLFKNELSQITQFDNPFKGLQNVYKDVIKYKREDGLDLSATLYLPADYDQNIKENLPMIMWAYPREFKDKSSASQTTQNPNKFTYPYWGSPIYWLTKGYAILDNASFPIVGIKDNEPQEALTDMKDGYTFYNRYADILKKTLERLYLVNIL